MRNACRKAFAAAIVLLFIAAADSFAQRERNNLLKPSVDPEADSLFFIKTRQRMDEIRKTCRRPTVGLVLAGGGAKGAATVGVLKYLEELEIPIDLIAGTSIGGLLGSFYALGYTAADLEELIMTQDWDIMLTDQVDRKYHPYEVKEYRNKYILSFPFDLGKTLTGDPSDGTHSFAGSLPSGYAEGFNVNKLISSMTVGYQGEISFADLPKPFACVAGDLVSTLEKNFGEGELGVAMRATMSIPGLFNPVRHDGMVLVDGGVRNNIPVDIARAMGADLIITVSLSQKGPEYSDITNVGSIVGGLMDLLTRDTIEDSKRLSTVYINPELKDYNMLSFNIPAIEDMLSIGYETAKSQEKELLNLKKRVVGRDVEMPDRPKAVNINKTAVELASVEFAGVSDEDAQILSRRIAHFKYFGPGQKVKADQIYDILNELKATGLFSDVNFSLLGTEEPYRLIIKCVPAPTNKFGIGLRMDNQDWASLLFNVGINSNSLSGSRVDLTAKIGNNLGFTAQYSHEFIDFPTFNAEFSVNSINTPLWFVGRENASKITANVSDHKESVFFTITRMKNFYFNAGILSRFASLDKNSILWREFSAMYPEAENRAGFVGTELRTKFYSFDNKYFPTKGQDMSFSANWDFMSYSNPDFKKVVSLALDYKGAYSVGSIFALMPEVNLRWVYNSKEISLFHTNFFGGDFAGRYAPHQVAYFGVNGVVLSKPFLSTATLEARYKLTNNLYASFLGGVVKEGYDFKDYFSSFDVNYYSVGFQLALNFITGPIKLNYHYTSVIGSELYFSFGYNF